MSNSPLDDCTGIALAVGSVRGIRTFDVDALGRLTAVTRKSVWRPGENTATCPLLTQEQYEERHVEEDEQETGYEVTYHLSGFSSGWLTAGPRYCRGIAHPMCSCGFYAYHDGSVYPTGQVTGVIEGYGKTTVGTKGFRCEKARIVALALAPRRKATWFDWLENGAAILSGASAGHWFGRGVEGGPWWTWVLTAVTFAVSVCLWHLADDRRRARRKHNRDVAPLHDLVARNYPGVALFESVKEMKQAYPPDRGERPSPETDPSFWERSA